MPTRLRLQNEIVNMNIPVLDVSLNGLVRNGMNNLTLGDLFRHALPYRVVGARVHGSAVRWLLTVSCWMTQMVRYPRCEQHGRRAWLQRDGQQQMPARTNDP
jgi:hypothetical protein